MSDHQKKFYFNWRIIAQIIGWVGITVSIGLIVIYGPLTLIYYSLVHNITFLVMCGMFGHKKKHFDFCLLMIFLLQIVSIGLNLFLCISWLVGIPKVSIFFEFCFRKLKYSNFHFRIFAGSFTPFTQLDSLLNERKN